jgi:predicted RND superfamily exporter protein
MIRHKLFEGMARFAVYRPRTVMLAVALLSAVSLALVFARMELKTSNLDLIDPGLPPVKAFLDFAREFGTPNLLVVALEGSDPATLEQVTNELAPELRAVPGVRSVLHRIPLDDQKLADAGVEPYLATRDHGMYMIFIQPEDARSQVDTIAPLITAVQRILNVHALEDRGVSAGLTGIPKYAIDDRDVIQHDINLLSGISFLFIGLIFVLGFSALRRPLLAMVVLAFSVVLVVGAVSVYPGYLTLLSAFFASILFGLGIDYGIHIINRIEESMREGMPEHEAIPASIGAIAPELTTGALTTAVAFFALTATEFKGFAELGLIAGVGVLVCLVTMSLVLPALLVLASSPKEAVKPRDGSRMGRLLFRLQHPALTVPFTLAGIALCLIGGPGFDGDYTHIQPGDSEAVRLERAMADRSDLSTQFAVFTVDSKGEAIALADRLVDEPTVSEVRSIADLDMLAPAGGGDAWPEEFVRGFVSPSNRFAVYAYPVGNIWDPVTQEAFVGSMQAIDPGVTGMPFLGKFMTEASNRALQKAGLVGGVLLFLCVWLNFRRLLPTVLAVVPTYLTVAGMFGIMKLLGIPFNPLNVMALPVILGIAVDDGVHIVHRFIHDRGDLARVFAGAGRSVVLTSLTTMAAFASLALTRHRGLASFSVLLVIGVGYALLLSVLVLPRLLTLARNRLLA